MNEFQKSQAVRISNIYGKDIQKGKKAEIGTVKNYSGINYIKTSEGWKPYKTHGHLKKNIPTLTESENKKENKNTLIQESNLRKLDKVNSEFTEIKRRLNYAGFSDHHKNFTILEDVNKKLIEGGKKIINNNPDLNFEFELKTRKHSDGTRSLEGEIGVLVSEIKKNLIDDYNANKESLPNVFDTNNWTTQKIKDICNRSGVKPSDASFNHISSNIYGTYVYVILAENEISNF